MFSKVRWRIALWFIGLSTAAYVVPTVLALALFYVNLTAAIDRELDGFMASFGHAINVVAGKPVLRDWARTVQTTPAHSLVTYQLFDKDGNILETHFPPGIPTLFRHEREVSARGMTMRTHMTALKEGDKIVGYLQVQLPTKARDDAVDQLALVTIMFAPVVLLGLGWSSYLVSEKATVQIRQTLELLRRFVADASHELYTPLTVVQAAHESLARLVAPSGIGASELEASESALERMEKMIEDLALLSNMETLDRSEEPEVLDVAAILTGVVNEFRPKFEQKGVALSPEPGPVAKMHGNPGELARLFANIIENAWRYTEPGGSVRVCMTRDAHHAQISIIDTGMGIPKESLPLIFDRFYRVDQSRTRNSGGSGLGLSIAMAIAHSHGGTIEVQSQPQHGSTFRISLPVESA